MKILNTKKEKIILAIIATVFLLLTVFFGVNHFSTILSNSLTLIVGVLWLVVLAFIIVLAGSIVVRALFGVAAGLSLLIFLAQSYCAPGVSRTLLGNQALQALIALGLLYVAYDFSSAMYAEYKEQKIKLKAVEGKWTFAGVMMFTLLTLFIVSFVSMVYQVVNPIILGFCVYK